MSAATPQTTINRLLEGLPGRERNRLLTRCECIDLAAGTVLCESDSPFQNIYFPLTAIISLVAIVRDHEPLEMSLVGREGMLGVTLVLSIDTAPLRAVVQVSGRALRIGTPQFQDELDGSAALRSTLNRYLYVSMTQLSQTGACARFHEIEARLARLLLMTHDRSPGNRFHLTHEFLADMLGVRRSGITIAAGALQQRRLIRYTRGEIEVIDREGLEAASCECYAAGIEDYARLLN